MPRCILVIPCYNEAHRLDREAIVTFLHEHENINLLFVNDGSTDDTGKVLDDLAVQFSPSTTLDGDLVMQKVRRVEVLDMPTNGGKARAVQAGMQSVIGKADFVGYWDADLSTPLSELDLFFQEFETFPQLQIVLGSRVKIMGRNIIRKRSRHYIGRIFATLVSVLLQTPFYDTQCGAKLFRSTDTLAVLFEKPFTSRWIFDVELLNRYLKQQAIAGETDASRLIHEVALNNWEDKAGSKLRPHDFVIAFWDLLKLYFRR